MRKINIIAVFSFFITGCATYHYPISKNNYVTQFRLRYFEACLAKGFDNDEIRYLNGLDKSGMSDRILALEDYQYIDSLAFRTTRNVEQVSSLTGGQIAEGSEGKHVYSQCLENYQSTWLNKLAKKRFKKAKNNAMHFYQKNY